MEKLNQEIIDELKAIKWILVVIAFFLLIGL